MRHPLTLSLLVLIACGDGGEGDTATQGARGDDTATAEDEGCGPATDPGTLSPLDIDGDPACGEPIFQMRCAGCHGTDGQGADPGPAIGEHVVAHTDEELLFVLLVGQDDMPPQGLGNRENAHVLAWLRATFGAYNGTGH